MEKWKEREKAPGSMNKINYYKLTKDNIKMV